MKLEEVNKAWAQEKNGESLAMFRAGISLGAWLCAVGSRFIIRPFSFDIVCTCDDLTLVLMRQSIFQGSSWSVFMV